MEVIAKKDKNGRTQLLKDHTEWVLDEMFSLIDDKSLSMVSNQTGVCMDKLRDLIFYCGFFHDIGKATVQFQDTIKDNRGSYHSFYSAGSIAHIDEFSVSIGNVSGFNEQLNMLFLIIITHHSLYNENSSFRSEVNAENFRCEYLPLAKHFFDISPQYYEKYLGKKCPYVFEYNNKPYSPEDIVYFYNYTIFKRLDIIKSTKSYERTRCLYSYVLGLLNMADWLASARFDGFVPPVKLDEVPEEQRILEKFRVSINKRKDIKLDSFIPRQFQKRLSRKKGNVVVEIPTGEGKTEGAILWAVNNIRSIHSKIIYTLPTQTTSNKLFDRTKDLFGELTGLVHGASRIYLEKIYKRDNGLVDSEFKSELLFNRYFAKPVTVSTIDGLFKYYINMGRYNIAMLNVLNSVVIIDEVHSYDYKLMGFLKKFIELAVANDIPICIMSASIPQKIKELLQIDKWETITDKKLFDKKAINIIKVDTCMECNYDRIIEEYRNGKNVLVVRNTVGLSVCAFESIKGELHDNERIMLYNSNFKKIDRVEKENDIYNHLKCKKPFILVATQVVEVSLDIDFDVMFTDLAPIDALIQRFGRVNRDKKADRIADVFVYNVTNPRPYDRDILDLTIAIIEEGVYPISRYTEWLNNVYDCLFMLKKNKNSLSKLFDPGYNEYENKLKQLKGISEYEGYYELRNIAVPTNDYLLRSDYEKGLISYEYTVSLPCYKVKDNDYVYKLKDLDEGIKYDVLDVEYSYEKGVTFDKSSYADIISE